MAYTGPTTDPADCVTSEGAASWTAPAKPAGLADGDWWVIQLATDAAAGTGGPNWSSHPAGWELIGVSTGYQGLPACWVWAKKMVDASAEPSPDFHTTKNGTGGGFTQSTQTSFSFRISGAEGLAPSVIGSWFAEQPNSVDITVPAVETLDDNTLLTIHWGHDMTGSPTYSSGLTEVDSVNSPGYGVAYAEIETAGTWSGETITGSTINECHAIVLGWTGETSPTEPSHPWIRSWSSRMRSENVTGALVNIPKHEDDDLVVVMLRQRQRNYVHNDAVDTPTNFTLRHQAANDYGRTQGIDSIFTVAGSDVGDTVTFANGYVAYQKALVFVIANAQWGRLTAINWDQQGALNTGRTPKFQTVVDNELVFRSWGASSHSGYDIFPGDESMRFSAWSSATGILAYVDVAETPTDYDWEEIDRAVTTAEYWQTHAWSVLPADATPPAIVEADLSLFETRLGLGNNAATDLVVKHQPGWQVDDLAILVALIGGNANSSTKWDDPPAGWNTLIDNVRTTQGTDKVTSVFYKVMEADEPDVTLPLLAGSVNEPRSGVINYYRGVDVEDPFDSDNVVGPVNITNNMNPTPPAITVSDDDSLVVVLWTNAASNDFDQWGAPDGYLLARDNGVASARQMVLAHRYVDAGVETPGAWDFLGDSSIVSDPSTWTFVLKPAAGGAPPVEAFTAELYDGTGWVPASVEVYDGAAWTPAELTLQA